MEMTQSQDSDEADLLEAGSVHVWWGWDAGHYAHIQVEVMCTEPVL